MLLEQAIMEVLKRHSSKEKTNDTKPLNRAEILRYLIAEFPDEHRAEPITAPRVRKMLDKMIASEMCKNDEDRAIFYSSAMRKDGSEYRTSYWAAKSITDLELKFLVDSVLSSKIFDSASAVDFAKRIQAMSGKNLYRMTSYATESLYGKQRMTINVNVLKNIEAIIEAEKKNAFIKFDFNVYDVTKDKQIGLAKRNTYTVKPIHVILNEGRYFMLARYQDGNKVYTFSVDLMSDIMLQKDISDSVNANEYETNFNRAKYFLQHPYNFGGVTERFKLRVKREYLSRVVDTFSYDIQIIADSVLNDTVDIRVNSSLEGIKRWLLFNYDIAEVIEPKEELKQALLDAAKIIFKKYE